MTLVDCILLREQFGFKGSGILTEEEFDCLLQDLEYKNFEKIEGLH